MSWHYRVMRHPEGHLAVHEVYCDEAGQPNGWSQEPTTFIGDGADALQEVITALERALKDARQRPILEFVTGKAGQPNDTIDTQEWTDEDFAQAVPFEDAHPAAFDFLKRGIAAQRAVDEIIEREKEKQRGDSQRTRDQG